MGENDTSSPEFQAFLREEVRKRIQASMVAYGSDGTNLRTFLRDFKRDFPGEDIFEAAKLLNFGDGEPGVLAMLKDYQNDIEVHELLAGLVQLKPVAEESLKENLDLINKTNKDVKKERAIKERMRQSRMPPGPNPNQIPLSNCLPTRFYNVPPPPAPRPPFNVPPPPATPPPVPPPSGVFKVPFPPGLQQQQQPKPSTSKAPPPPPGGNANKEPLGPRRQPSAFSSSASAHSSSFQQRSRSRQGSGSGGSGSRGPTPQPQQQRQHPFQQQRSFQPSSSAAWKRQQAPYQQQQSMQNGGGNNNGFGGEQWKNIQQGRRKSSDAMTTTQEGSRFPDNTDFYEDEDDFHGPPSFHGSFEGGLDRMGFSEGPGRQDRMGFSEGPDRMEFCFSGGFSPPIETNVRAPEEVKTEEMKMEEEEEEWEVFSDISDFDFDADDDSAEDLEECAPFIGPNGEQFTGNMAADLWRLIHLFRANNGGRYTSSKWDALKKAYSDAFGAVLSSKELNRLLTAPAVYKIARDSFKKCTWPGCAFFRVTESTTSYTVELLASLAEASIDLDLFRLDLPGNRLFALAPAAAPSTSSAPSPASSSSTRPCPPPTPSPAPMPAPMVTAEQAKQFTALAVYAFDLLTRAKGGQRKTLGQLFERIGKENAPGSFPEPLMNSPGALYAYLSQYFPGSFSFEFGAEKAEMCVSPTEMRPRPDAIPLVGASLDKFEHFRAGDRHRVTLAKLPDANSPAILRLSSTWAKLRELLSEYAQILTDLDEKPVEKPRPDQPVFFIDVSDRQLCRGEFKRLTGPSSPTAIVLNVDTGKERCVQLKDLFHVPANFPGWLFPPCHLLAHFVAGAGEARLRDLWGSQEEFSVQIVVEQQQQAGSKNSSSRVCRVKLVREE